MDKADSVNQISPEMERTASLKARDRSKAARWDLNVAIFLFAILIVIILLSFQGIGVEIVAPIAVFGLAMVWLVGWRNGRQTYNRFYEEELEQEVRKTITIKGTVEETIEQQVQKALRERWR
jgi:FlaA1/EpsC-like NDP-sugar epimerase